MRATILLGAALAAMAVAAPSGAIVPPKDCGRVTVGGKRYDIKADQLRCPTARRYSTTYLRSRHRPARYSCHRYRGTALVFRCVNGSANPDRTFFAIKR
jgi:hypothetical protein